MANYRDQLVLGGAFATAVMLHVAVLPIVGEAVGDVDDSARHDAELLSFDAPGLAKAGDTVTYGYRFTVRQQSQSFSCGVGQQVYLSRDLKADATDLIVLATSHQGHFEPGAMVETRERKQDLPKDVDGPYWLIAELSLHHELVDADPANNTRSVPIYIDGPQQPELVIDRFDTPTQAVAGGCIRIDYAVTNAGLGWANAPDRGPLDQSPNWIDHIYLSDNPTLDELDLPLRAFERTAPLGPDAGYRHEQVQLAIPRGLTGKRYLIAAADSGQVLDQPSFMQGFRVKPIELVDTNAPDLVVAAIEDVQRLVIGRPSPVRFSVANLGSAATHISDWMDGLYLSREPELNRNAIPLMQVQASDALAPRTRYDSSASVIVPEAIEAGQWYLVVKTDDDNAVDESVFEDNNTLAVPVTVLTQQQADAEIQLGKPENPERLVVQWIEHDRLEEHRARLSRTVQPALQDKADPVPDAPLNVQPKPMTLAQRLDNAAGDPASPDRPVDLQNQQDARPTPTPPDPTQTSQAPRPQQPANPITPRVDGLPGDTGELPQQRPGADLPVPPIQPTPSDTTPNTSDTPTPLPGEREVDSPADPDAPLTDSDTDSQTPSEIQSATDAINPNENPSELTTEQLNNSDAADPAEQTDAKEPTQTDGKGDSDNKQKPSTATPSPSKDKTPKPDGETGDPAQASESQDPTRAPRNDSEAPPTNNVKVEVRLQEGQVLVGEGIEVTTKLPTPPGTGARRFSLPRNARISVTFDAEGQVHEAKMLRSTTYKDWDAAIEASLYRWSARGEAIDDAKPYVTIEWDYILNELLDEDE